MGKHATEWLNTITDQLELNHGVKDTFYGLYRDYPIAVSSFGDDDVNGLLFQIRHIQDGASLPGNDALAWGPGLQQLISAEKAAVSVEGKIAWLTLYDTPAAEQVATPLTLLDMVLDSLESAGITGVGDRCHYCLTNRVDSVTFDAGRVGLICTECLADRKAARQREAAGTKAGMLACVMLSATGAAVGAVSWAGCWIAYDWLIDLISNGKKKVFLPNIVLIGWIGAVCVLVGGPAGYLIGRIANRQLKYTGWIGATGAIVAILAGELLFCTWLVYILIGTFSVHAGRMLLMEYWKDAPLFYLFAKGCAAFFSILLAYDLAKPKRPSMKL